MATQSPTKTGKRGRPRLKTIKARPSITLDQAVLKAGQKLAFQEGVSFSAWLNRLVRERIQTGAV